LRATGAAVGFKCGFVSLNEMKLKLSTRDKLAVATNGLSAGPKGGFTFYEGRAG